jgi:cytochrome P450
MASRSVASGAVYEADGAWYFTTYEAVRFLLLAAANRNPDLGESADDIDLARGRSQAHLAFGGGIHRCLGSHLARQEVRLVVEEFHARIPDYELAPGFTPQVVWPSGTLHVPKLPLVFTR